MNTLDPGTKLHKIIESKKTHLEEQKRRKSYLQLERELKKVKPFQGPSLFDALKSQTPHPKLIAEAKKASPSQGIIRSNFSLSEINEAYQSIANVVAISVLTEKDYFQGSDDILSFFAQNNTNNKPLLRKDFIFDPYQILETKVLGAQAYLLIASLFKDAAGLEKLIQAGRELDLEALVEVHTEEELEMVKNTSARVIGVNSRDMKSLKVDLGTHQLLKDIDDNCAKVAESGIETSEYLKQVSGFCDATLVGGHLMAQPNISVAIKELVS